jgi:hypothetical protein
MASRRKDNPTRKTSHFPNFRFASRLSSSTLLKVELEDEPGPEGESPKNLSVISGVVGRGVRAISELGVG